MECTYEQSNVNDVTNKLAQLTLNEGNEVSVGARALHDFLGVRTEFKVWFSRMSEYGFEENQDYTRVYQKCNTLGGSQTIVDYNLKIDTAKEICMLQRSDKGKIARKYFINVEKQFNSPEAIVSRLLEMLNNKNNINNGIINNENQSINLQTRSYIGNNYTTLSQGDLLTNLRDTAKILGIKESLFIGWLLLNNYCYRDKKDNIKPSAKMMKYFSLRAFTTESGHSGLQTLVNSRGRSVFMDLLIDEGVIVINNDFKLLN